MLYEREINGEPSPVVDMFEQSKKGLLYQRDLKAHTGCVNAVDFSPTEEWIASGGDDLKVRVWRTGDCCTSEKPGLNSVVMKSIHHSNIFCLRFSHHTERIYSAGNDHRLLVHDIKTRELLRSYRARSTIYYTATHPSDDNVIAAASGDKNVYLFDLRGNEGDGLCTKLRQEGAAYCAVWNPQNHNFVAVCNKKKGLLVYDLRMNNITYAEAGKMTKRAMCADWSPSGELLLCVISQANPICFNLQNSEHLQLSDPKYSNICTVKSCAFAGEQYMISGSDDWNIYVWKCWSGLPLRDSYQKPKRRVRIAVPVPYGELEHGAMDSDTEEDLDTLQRFDYFYEQTLRSAARTVIDSSDDDLSDGSSDEEIARMLFPQTQYDEDANDHESFFSEITSGLHSPSPLHSPNSSQSDDN
uniref:WD_REPEATS_REGION domain-containing protein n=1 Tax=Globodera pallida TaxID=36090 RepID=A0A183BLL0_GLOPA